MSVLRRSRWPALAGVASCALSATLVGCGADNRPATWEYISAVITQPNCATASCHSPASAVAGLDFSDGKRGYTSLMKLKVWIVGGTDGCRTIDGNVVCQRDFRPLVSPYDPEQSRLVNMLRSRGAALMPPDRPLPEADIRLIERWILNGAPYTGTGGPDAATHDRPPTTVTVTVTPLDAATAAATPAADAGAKD